MTLPKNDAGRKIAWQGVFAFGAATDPVDPLIRSAQPYLPRLHPEGEWQVGSEAREFLVGVGQGAHTKHQLQAGNAVSGNALPVADPWLETVELYKVSKLKVTLPEAEDEAPPHPWRGVPPLLAVYRERGHRRLAARTFQEKGWSCIWGCRMPVELTIDQWNPSRRHYRTETFCYGPRSCLLYQAGPARKVPGRRRGMTYTEEDWVDDEATSHRRLEE